MCIRDRYGTHGFAYNPLSISQQNMAQGKAVTTQVYQIADTLDKIFTLGDQQKANLRFAMFRAYEDRGLSRQSTEFPNDYIPPSFETIFNIIEQQVEDTKLLNRLAPIRDFNLFSSGAGSLQSLIETSNIISLGKGLSDEMKEVCAEFLLRGVYETLASAGSYNGIRLAIFVDEAHRIANLDSVKILLKEARMFGGAVFLSTQEAGDLDAPIYANAETVTSFQLKETRDSKKVAELFTTTSKAQELADKIRALQPHHAYIKNAHHKRCVPHKVLSLEER